MTQHGSTDTCPHRKNVDDDRLLDLVQRQTFGFFWEGAHPVSGLARDRQKTTSDPNNDLVAVGGTGFGIMAMIVAVNRGWLSRSRAVARLSRMLSFLEICPRYHGMFAHFLNGRTGETIRFRRKDDGADLVESALLYQGLICAVKISTARRPGARTSRADRCSVGCDRMALVHARRPAAFLALEPQPWHRSYRLLGTEMVREVGLQSRRGSTILRQVSMAVLRRLRWSEADRAWRGK